MFQTNEIVSLFAINVLTKPISTFWKTVSSSSLSILFAKTIDGIYTADPKVDPNAKKYDKISYLDIINQKLKVIDSTATSLCMDNKIPCIIFGIDKPGG